MEGTRRAAVLNDSPEYRDCRSHATKTRAFLSFSKKFSFSAGSLISLMESPNLSLAF